MQHVSLLLLSLAMLASGPPLGAPVALMTEAKPSYPKVSFKVHIEKGIVVMEPLLPAAFKVVPLSGPSLKDKAIVRCQTGAETKYHDSDVNGIYTTLDCGGSKFGVEEILFAPEQ